MLTFINILALIGMIYYGDKSIFLTIEQQKLALTKKGQNIPINDT